ncbi:hypothetical protein DFA_04583 [Cavenderia fasciculata]|uniref:GGDEF domain-containing protein n=1 Tax=Cavenderia fasciculata TaxID=261658 RepID=F4PPZ4_CACFS|nr:uncharacterized protein DFA_04583 [Cavenderia fasciculata]EGG22457.1 hypothetical protein DFA_04583 [Cavenderia fasciculata]|eukprot:XP_004360308.1 hypothetical protein DFA_04583 [Cavenderia fasciculata]
MEIISNVQSILILEIDFFKNTVKYNNNKPNGSTEIISIKQFCQSYKINQDILKKRITSFNCTILDFSIKNYRLSGKYIEKTSLFQGIIIDNSQEKLKLKRLKNTLSIDPLTGLQNRYQLYKKIQKFCSISNTDHCAIYFIDLDHFKQINDIHGHDNGDVVLRSVANRFQKYADESVLPVRLSGDEFLIVKRDIESTEQANQFINQYLSNVQSENINLVNCKTNIKVSLSFGGVVFTKSQSTMVDKLIKKSDQLMYQMKKNNHNNSCIIDFVE